MTDRALLVFCGLLMTVSAFSVDITLPFFRAMATDFATPMPAIQATVTVYIFSIGLGQVVFGPLSDRIGRRPAIAAGLLIYLAGALVCLVAPSVEIILLGRALQGFGGAAGAVVSRAILRDRASGTELARNMAISNMIFSAGPILAPIIGVAVAAQGGSWRAVFVALLVYAVCLLLALRRAPETLTAKRPDALNFASLGRNALTILADGRSRYFLMVTIMSQSLMVSLISSAPRVYESEFGATGATFALFFAVHGVGVIIGQLINHRLIDRIGVAQAAMLASLVMIAGSGAMALAAGTGWLTIYTMTAFVILFAVGYLSTMANATALILDSHGQMAGFASSFVGCLGQVLGAVIATLVALVAGGRALPLALYLLTVSSIVALLLANWVWRRH